MVDAGSDGEGERVGGQQGGRKRVRQLLPPGEWWAYCWWPRRLLINDNARCWLATPGFAFFQLLLHELYSFAPWRQIF